MRYIFYIGVLSLIGLSCSGNQPQKKQNETIITAPIEEKANIPYFSVYQFSDKTTAIVSNFSENPDSLTIFDDIFEKIDSKDSLSLRIFNYLYDNAQLPDYLNFYDSTPTYRFFANNELQTKIRPLLNNTYYVYGTKGGRSVSIDRVLFGLEECRTNIFAFTIPEYNISKYGNPLIASEKELDLIYSDNFDEIEDKVNEYYKNLNYDYTDNIKYKVFARSGDMYFVYSDNFEWKSHFESGVNECLFPSRAIFRLESDGKVKPIWKDELDLLGIPCD